MTTPNHRGSNWFRLVVYGALLVLLATLLYREASLGRNLGSPPVLFVCLAGASHVLAGFTWRRAGFVQLWLWSTWVLIALSVMLSVRLMVPI